jgi:hypothetical protein
MSVDANTVQILSDIANRLRIHSIESTAASNSGFVFKISYFLSN